MTTEGAIRLANDRGYGDHVHTETFAGTGCGCFASGLLLLALVAGVALGVNGRWQFAAAVLAAGIVLLLIALRADAGRNKRAPTLYCFETGLVLARSEATVTHPWSAIELIRTSRTELIGQALTQRTFTYLELHTGDVLLVRLSTASSGAQIVTELVG